MKVKTFLVFIVSVLGFGLLMEPANSTTESSNVHQLCYTYNPQYTHMAPYPGNGEIYQGLPAKFTPDTRNTIQPWNGYCPSCTLKDKSACAALPCQTHNLKSGAVYQGIEAKDNKWMKMANEEALKSVKNGGGPFGAVIVQIDDKTGKVIRYWVNHNHVVQWNDPTAHAEVSTIRVAAKDLGVTNLGHIRQQDSNYHNPVNGHIA